MPCGDAGGLGLRRARSPDCCCDLTPPRPGSPVLPPLNHGHLGVAVRWPRAPSTTPAAAPQASLLSLRPTEGVKQAHHFKLQGAGEACT